MHTKSVLLSTFYKLVAYPSYTYVLSSLFVIIDQLEMLSCKPVFINLQLNVLISSLLTLMDQLQIHYTCCIIYFMVKLRNLSNVINFHLH